MRAVQHVRRHLERNAAAFGACARQGDFKLTALKKGQKWLRCVHMRAVQAQGNIVFERDRRHGHPNKNAFLFWTLFHSCSSYITLIFPARAGSGVQCVTARQAASVCPAMK